MIKEVASGVALSALLLGGVNAALGSIETRLNEKKDQSTNLQAQAQAEIDTRNNAIQALQNQVDLLVWANENNGDASKNLESYLEEADKLISDMDVKDSLNTEEVDLTYNMSSIIIDKSDNRFTTEEMQFFREVSGRYSYMDRVSSVLSSKTAEDGTVTKHAYVLTFKDFSGTWGSSFVNGDVTYELFRNSIESEREAFNRKVNKIKSPDVYNGVAKNSIVNTTILP